MSCSIDFITLTLIHWNNYRFSLSFSNLMKLTFQLPFRNQSCFTLSNFGYPYWFTFLILTWSHIWLINNLRRSILRIGSGNSSDWLLYIVRLSDNSLAPGLIVRLILSVNISVLLLIVTLSILVRILNILIVVGVRLMVLAVCLLHL